MKEIRLNIGAGDTKIKGFTPIDRKVGKEAYPLEYPDDSVDEIRASHILEHFSFAEIQPVLKDWVRVLKPGGRIRLAVPDFSKCVRVADRDRLWSRYIMGGQTDENDYHKSIWTEPDLRHAMSEAGVTNIQPWTSDNTDAASLPISLNLEGVKGIKESEIVKICALMSIPRVGWNDNWGQVHEALGPLGIPVRRASGAYWEQGMQQMFLHCVESKSEIDWILTIDYDTMFTHEHVSMLMQALASNPQIDALAALQPKRQSELPLMTMGHLGPPKKGKKSHLVEIKNEPVKVTTAHFGLTLIRVDALREVAMPWFFTDCCDDGRYGYGHLDADIWFWHQWRKAGKTIYVDPRVRVGHLEVMVHEFDHEMKSVFNSVIDWREQHGYPDEAGETCEYTKSDSKDTGEQAAAKSSGRTKKRKSSPRRRKRSLNVASSTLSKTKKLSRRRCSNRPRKREPRAKGAADKKAQKS